MPIERSALDATRHRLTQKEATCLGCADCTGACWSLLELSRLPETVLHPRTPRA